jgi:hypothetical protein
MKRHLFYLLATFSAYSAVTTVLIGRWIERNSQVDDELDDLAATPTPPPPARLFDQYADVVSDADERQASADRYFCEELETRGLV